MTKYAWKDVREEIKRIAAAEEAEEQDTINLFSENSEIASTFITEQKASITDINPETFTRNGFSMSPDEVMEFLKTSEFMDIQVLVEKLKISYYVYDECHLAGMRDYNLNYDIYCWEYNHNGHEPYEEVIEVRRANDQALRNYNEILNGRKKNIREHNRWVDKQIGNAKNNGDYATAEKMKREYL